MGAKTREKATFTEIMLRLKEIAVKLKKENEMKQQKSNKLKIVLWRMEARLLIYCAYELSRRKKCHNINISYVFKNKYNFYCVMKVFPVSSRFFFFFFLPFLFG